ncbi:MAG: hypothetical protein BV457_07445 [Thermoplasmata archaeon M9B1D]|nr:MAG: hypothetical protein BV457_07445 [Thermoplasmata archaeon M9B1D]
MAQTDTKTIIGPLEKVFSSDKVIKFSVSGFYFIGFEKDKAQYVTLLKDYITKEREGVEIKVIVPQPEKKIHDDFSKVDQITLTNHTKIYLEDQLIFYPAEQTEDVALINDAIDYAIQQEKEQEINNTVKEIEKEVYPKILQNESRALTTQNNQLTNSSSSIIDQWLEQWKQLQEFDKKLLDENDYQKIGDKLFKKKSAFRKYARFYQVADEIIKEQRTERPDGSVMVEVWVKAWRSSHPEDYKTGYGAVDSKDKCFKEDHWVKKKDLKTKKEEWLIEGPCSDDCSGKKHFAHPEHDIHATAHTRAKNRAISDLIAGGEVSAEEVE